LLVSLVDASELTELLDERLHIRGVPRLGDGRASLGHSGLNRLATSLAVLVYLADHRQLVMQSQGLDTDLDLQVAHVRAFQAGAVCF
jgi:hypothetical protein